MPNQLTVKARAKVNLALDVLGRREDGYHDLRMVMQTVSLHDTLILRRWGRRRGDAPEARLMVRACPRLPVDQRNLALAAARLFLERTRQSGFALEIELIKRIPVGAGLGGGSADAAAVLRGLRRMLMPRLTDETLRAWALELGSDVPYCVTGGTCLAEGRGEVLTPLAPLADCYIVLCKPGFFISTRRAFAELGPIGRRPDIPALLDALARGDLSATGRSMLNVFEAETARRHGAPDAIRAVMERHGAAGAVMSGSGPAMLGLFAEESSARAACQALKGEFPKTVLCRPVPADA
ncbi:MAG: 4-(cytidine 5'-diphospho)-2-C-methyl-D-erythritol kinase [Oscillospiraceae bacterium]|nr:4-(cytidine 5'-diphospho)-2-C-methyl-D-erythritol kinase [Oscillospiraceae bacterium]